MRRLAIVPLAEAVNAVHKNQLSVGVISNEFPRDQHRFAYNRGQQWKHCVLNHRERYDIGVFGQFLFIHHTLVILL
jgi:hypothetical protein